NSVELSAEQRFTRDMMVRASYTFSNLKGNFPGLFSPETGQLDPNLTSMYDMPELMANRYGDLAVDRPHQVKLDGYYMRTVENVGRFSFGGSARATSGIPHGYLGAHKWYGLGETYILPRGEAGRSPFTTRFDVKLQYGRELGGGRMIEVFADVFNLFNQQPELDVDENYTYENVNAIVGGDAEDLAHLKVLDPGTDLTSPFTPTQNPNFGNVA
ncbi:MAG: TonB-dependent receptor, partial [Deltaproteobacteria bacterium]|nr:TonB-dependent receptor [Deltaproteobacteria bacterium]